MKKKFLAMLMAMLIMLVSVASTQVFASTPGTFTVTIDFGGHIDDYVVENVAEGTLLGNIIENIPRELIESVYVEGYRPFAVSLKPISEYDSYEAASEASSMVYDTAVTSDMTVYILCAEYINEVRINVESPICGTEATVEEGDDESEWDTQTNKPVVTFEDAEKFENDFLAYWITADEEIYNGSFTYGEKYIAGIEMMTKFPYEFDYSKIVNFYINGVKIEDTNKYYIYGQRYAVAIGEVECTEHNWGEWEVVKEPTTTEEGLERRVCLGDPTHIEERPISKLDEPEPIDELNTYYFASESSVSANTYTLESGENLKFKVECDTESNIISKFLGIEVDGEPVDISNYDATAGSVDISLHADYLDTLSEGEHTLTALFDDGEVETTFTILPDDSEDVDVDSEPVDDTPEVVATPTVPANIPTGDGETNALLSMLMAICFAVMCMAALAAGKRYKAKYLRR